MTIPERIEALERAHWGNTPREIVTLEFEWAWEVRIGLRGEKGVYTGLTLDETLTNAEEALKEEGAQMSELPLPRFNPEERCPKCGDRNVGKKFWARTSVGKLSGESSGGLPVIVHEVVQKERIERTCNGCGYKWDQAPLDVEEKS